MIKCKYEGTGIWNGRCVGTKEVDPCPGYDKCKQYKPNYTTNADRIRAMTDDEMNDLFRDIYDSGAYDAVSYGCGYQTNSFEWTMDWLQQPAEGE